MLTESVSDPRRANWLTISSMAEDLCWSEENGTSRPSWELEAEILRLTTRLMMRERELRQVKGQLKSQATKAQQQVATWRRRMDEKEEQMRIVLVQKDAEMQTIVSQLLLFEAELRQEQARIETLLGEKDIQIQKQQQEIDRLKSCLGNMQLQTEPKTVANSAKPIDAAKSEIRNFGVAKSEIKNFVNKEIEKSLCDSDTAVRKLKDGLIRVRAIQDLTNMRSVVGKTLANDLKCESNLNEKKRIPCKTPQKMKDLKAKRINPHKIHRSSMNELCGQVIL